MLAKLGGAQKPKPVAAAVEQLSCPAPLVYLWRWFSDVMDGVASNGMGPRQIAWQDLAAWCAITGTDIDPWEARVLLALSTQRAVIEDQMHGAENKNRADRKGH